MHYIAFEGPEGAGKTTQLRRLSARLRSAGLEGGEPRTGRDRSGEAVRELLLDPRRQLRSETEMPLFPVARAQLVREVMQPALARGQVALSDRSAYASLAYQGFGRGLELDVVRRVLLLDLPVEGPAVEGRNVRS